MNEQAFDGSTAGPQAAAGGPTSEQAAILAYLGRPFDATTTREQAGALISEAENEPAIRAHLQAWHRDKYRLHPDLFAPPQRSYREARWWQSQISGGSLYGYSFRQPSLEQTLVILGSLDLQEPGWGRESKGRRETRFMNELATLSPELCKPGCSFPQELPADDPSAPGAPGAPALPPPRVLSTPFVPGSVATPAYTPPTLPSRPAWTPSASSLSAPTAKTLDLVAERPRGGGRGWLPWALLLAAVGIIGAAGYVWTHRGEPELSAGAGPSPSAAAGSPKPGGPYAPVAAKDSRQRAVAKHPDLAQPGSTLNAKFIAAYRILESQRSPRLLQPDWPERLADEFAATPAPAPASSRTNAASPPPAAVPTATSAPASTGSLFVSLQAEYKNKVNTIKYQQHGAPQEAAVSVNVRSMMGSGARMMVRCVFFKRPTGRGDLRSVLSSSEKHFELAAGGTYSEAFDSPPVYRGRGATEEFDGWLVQLFPEGSDQFVKQVGSTGTIEELGRRTKF